MENLDISDSLRGYDYKIIYQNIIKYLEMLKSSDIETLYLTAGLIHEDQILLNWARSKLEFGEFQYFSVLLQFILDNNCSETVRYLYVYITKILVRLYYYI